MKTLGDLVKDDVKLGTIYFFLLLLTPSSTSTARVNILTLTQNFGVIEKKL